MWESDGSGVVGDDVRDFVGSQFSTDDSADFESSLFLLNVDQGESALDVVENSVVFVGFVNGNNVHESDWVFVITSNFSVDLDHGLFVLENQEGFSVSQSQAETVSDIKKNLIRYKPE